MSRQLVATNPTFPFVDSPPGGQPNYYQIEVTDAASGDAFSNESTLPPFQATPPGPYPNGAFFFGPQSPVPPPAQIGYPPHLMFFFQGAAPAAAETFRRTLFVSRAGARGAVGLG